jgi:hypothetical protein
MMKKADFSRLGLTKPQVSNLLVDQEQPFSAASYAAVTGSR